MNKFSQKSAKLKTKLLLVWLVMIRIREEMVTKVKRKKDKEDHSLVKYQTGKEGKIM